MAFTHYSPVTVQSGQVPSTLTDFPVLVLYTDARLKTIANGGNVANSSGFDIRPYSNSTLTTALTFELVAYDGTAGTVEMWVKVGSLADGSIIYLAYGDAALSTDGSSTSTWDSNFKGVWHNKESSGTTINDSTSNANHLTKKGATEPNPTTSGKVGAAQDYDGSNDWTKKASTTFNLQAAKTISLWCKLDTVDGTNRALIGSVNDDYQLQTRTTNLFYTEDGATTGPTTTALTTGSWFKIDITSNGSSPATMAIFKNGSSVVSGNHTRGASRTNIEFGSSLVGASRFVDGIIDEMRFSSVVRTADWLLTEYRNQSAPTTFAVLGTEVPTSTIESGAGTIASTGAVSGIGTGVIGGAGALTSTASITGVGHKVLDASGAITALSIFSGRSGFTGVISAISTIAGIGISTVASPGTISATGSVSGAGGLIIDAIGTIATTTEQSAWGFSKYLIPSSKLALMGIYDFLDDDPRYNVSEGEGIARGSVIITSDLTAIGTLLTSPYSIQLRRGIFDLFDDEIRAQIAHAVPAGSGIGRIDATTSLSGVSGAITSGAGLISASTSISGQIGYSTGLVSGPIMGIYHLLDEGERLQSESLYSHPEIVGTIAATASISAVSISTSAQPGTIAATGTILGVGASVAAPAGTITVTTTVVGMSPAIQEGAGTISASTSLIFFEISTNSGAGIINLVGNLVGVGTKVTPFAGNIASTSLLVFISDEGTSTGSISASSSFLGASNSVDAADGIIEATTTANFVSENIAVGVGAITASGDVAGAGNYIVPSVGQIDAVGAVQGVGGPLSSSQGLISVTVNIVALSDSALASGVISSTTIIQGVGASTASAVGLISGQSTFTFDVFGFNPSKLPGPVKVHKSKKQTLFYSYPSE